MKASEWSKTRPTKPGWYWCKNEGDAPGETWEAVVRIDVAAAGGERICCWMQSPGIGSLMRESEWSADCLWAGPITPPERANDVEQPVKPSAPCHGWGAWVKYEWDDQEPCCVRCGKMLELYNGYEWFDDPALNMCQDCCLTTLQEMRPNPQSESPSPARNG